MTNMKIIDYDTKEWLYDWIDCEYSIYMSDSDCKLKLTSSGRQKYVDSLKIINCADKRIVCTGYLLIQPAKQKFLTYRKVDVHIFI